MMTFKTLADVRKLIGHMPKEFRDRSAWQRIAALLGDAARSGDATPADVTVALELVLMMEKVTFRQRQ